MQRTRRPGGGRSGTTTCTTPTRPAPPHGAGRGQLDPSARIIAITIITSAGRRDAVCRLITTLLDPDCPTVEIIRLYHEHWEIETAFAEPGRAAFGWLLHSPPAPPASTRKSRPSYTDHPSASLTSSSHSPDGGVPQRRGDARLHHRTFSGM